MLIVAIRTLIMYIALLFSVRMMGKSELSKMSPFQLVIVFMIAELAAIPIDSADASLINGLVAIFMLMFLQILISFLSIKSESFKNFVSGKPTILIDKGKLNVSELGRLRITTTDLLDQNTFENKLRKAGITAFKDVFLAFCDENKQFHIYLSDKNSGPFAKEVII